MKRNIMEGSPQSSINRENTRKFTLSKYKTKIIFVMTLILSTFIRNPTDITQTIIIISMI